MWTSAAIFIIGLGGLVALFIGKALEIRGVRVAPLIKLRQADAAVLNSMRHVREHVPIRITKLGAASFVLCRAYLHRAGVTIHAYLEQYSVRFGEYLKKHRAVAKNPEAVSSYLKNVLEYKEEAIQNTDKKDIR